MANRSSVWAFGALSLIASAGVTPVAAATRALREAPRLLTLADAIETSRFMDASESDAGGILPSPDGKLFVVRIVKGDIASDGAWISFGVGEISKAGLRPSFRIIKRVFTHGLGSTDRSGGDDDTSSVASPIEWLDPTHVVFMLSDSNNHRQVMSLNAQTGDLVALTDYRTSVVSFGVAPSGDILFLGRVESELRSQRPQTDQLVVSPQSDPLMIAEGEYDAGDVFDRAWNSKWFLKPRNGVEREISVGPIAIDRAQPLSRLIKISPDSKLALICAPAITAPVAWDNYSHLNQFLAASLAAYRADRSAPASRDVVQLYLVRLSDGVAKPLWNAPADLLEDVSWSPDSRYVAIPKAYIPLSAGNDVGRVGPAVVNALTGEFWTANVEVALNAAWKSSGVAVFTLPQKRGRSESLGFDPRTSTFSPLFDEARSQNTTPVRIAESISQPPRLVYVSPDNDRTETIYDPNVNLLSKFSLGKSTYLSGYLPSGVRWESTILLPPFYEPHTKYPLIIQSVGGSKNALGRRFTLYGPELDSGLGPSQTSVYVSQTLAAKGIIIAQVSIDLPTISLSEQAARYTEAFDHVVSLLNSRAMIDIDRIGIDGFSRHGYFALYYITHSSTKIIASVLGDNYDGSYIQDAFTNWHPDYSMANGAAPFGHGLETWLVNAPGFNLQNVSGATLLESQEETVGAVLSRWEIFSRLKYLAKPVELFVMSDSDEHPSHSTQNPHQLLKIQDTVVDWFAFWLQNIRDPSIEKLAQYRRWDGLRK